jgi:anti-sigma regulatory factor (Ser/Thr protein kinase)
MHALHRDLTRDRFAPAVARQELEALRDELEPLLYEDLALLVTELVANSVRHAGASAGDRVGFDLSVTETLIRVDVRDGGPGFVPVPREPGDTSPYHWGLHIVEQVADRWAVVPASGNGSTTCVWSELDRSPDGRSGRR